MWSGWKGALLAVLAWWNGPLVADVLSTPTAPLFIPVTTTDGLPSNDVNALAEDASGYLWIGTQDGLARYDGVEFRIYRHEIDDAGSLQANSIQALHVDAQNRLWVGTEGGGAGMLGPDRQVFRRFSPESDERIQLRDVWAIASQPDGVVWLGGYAGGLHRIDPQANTVEVIRADPDAPHGLPSDHILDLLWLPDGRLIIGSSAGLAIWRNGAFEPVPPFSHPNPGMVLSLHRNRNGALWVGTQRGLEHLSGGEFKPVLEDEQGQVMLSQGVMKMLQDRHGHHWLGMRAGLRHMQHGVIRDAATHAALATGEMMLDMLEDHEGGLWFAIRNHGLFRLSPDWANFAVLRAGDAALGGLHSNQVSSSSADGRGGLWLMHRDGVLEHLAVNGASTRYPDAPTSKARVRFTASSLLARPDGKLWLGYSDGLSLYDPRSGEVQHWSREASKDAVPKGGVDSLHFDGEGRLWLSAYGGGLQSRTADGRVLRTWATGDEENGLPAGSVEDLAFASDGRPWLAGDFGVLRQDENEHFVSLPGVLPGRLMALAFAPDGHLWVARLGFVERYALREGKAELQDRIGQAQGLPAVEIGGLWADNSGDIWFTSIRGLWHYAPDNGVLRHYGTRNGLPGEEFLPYPPLVADNGVVAAATTKQGVVVFDPRRVTLARSEPHLVLEGASVLRPEGRTELDTRKAVQVNWDDRELSIKARLLSFMDTPSNRYRFHLRGYDTQWVDVDARGERLFTQLPPGNYVLEIVGGNASDVWSANPLRLPIHVAAPWWQQGWAYALYALASLLLIGLGIGAWRARITRRHQLEMAEHQREWAERASQAKSTFLATMGHEIRTPMTGVLGMAELLMKSPLNERQQGYVEAIKRSGDLMLRLVNDALDLARIEAGKLTLGDDVFDLHAVIEQVAHLMRPLAERKGLSFTLQCHPGLPRHVRGDAQRVQQIVLNLANNAVKFTETGSVAISAQRHESGMIDIAVRDTGPGLDAEQQSRLYQRFEQAEGHRTTQRYGGSGLGLAICQELAAAMGGRIHVESVPGQGTTFHVQLPLPQTEAPASALQPGNGPVQARDILLVEDDATVAEVVTGLLQSQGHRTRHAAHGLAALTELREHRYALVFMDLDLPGINGLELSRLIHAADPDLPIVALTARADPDLDTLSRAAGMQGFLRKPVRSNDLADIVQRFARDGNGE